MGGAGREAGAAALRFMLEGVGKEAAEFGAAAQIIGGLDPEAAKEVIAGWQVSGPCHQGNKKGNELFDVLFPPEEPDARDVVWRAQPVAGNPARFWHVDLVRSCGGSHPVGYLRTYIHSPESQQVLLELGSDDGIKVWLNGDMIHANNALRGVGRAQDKVTTTLKEGWNELLLKITNNGGGWGACVRVRTASGEHLKSLKVDARHQP